MFMPFLRSLLESAVMVRRRWDVGRRCTTDDSWLPWIEKQCLSQLTPSNELMAVLQP